MVHFGTHVGRFWRSDLPANVVPGHLTLQPGAGPALEAFGSLIETYREVPGVPAGLRGLRPMDPWAEPQVTIHGDLFQINERSSLMQASLRGSSQRYGGRVDDPGTQYIEAPVAFLGEYIEELTEPFGGIRVRLTYLDEWASLPGFAWSDRREVKDVQISHTFLDLPSVTFAGGILDFDSVVRVSPPNTSHAAMDRQCFLQLQLAQPAPWRDLDIRIITPLRSLLTLAVGKRCNPVQIQLRNSEGRWIDVIHRGIAEPVAKTIETSGMLAPHGILTIENVATWLSRSDTLGPLPPVVADSVAGNQHMLETELLELATVAEGLHRRLNPDSTAMTATAAESARGLAVGAVASMGEEVQRTVAAALQHISDLSFPRRLVMLAELAETAAPGITGRTNRWKRAVADSRNAFAHRLQPGFLQDEDLNQYMAVMTSLGWVLRIVLLLQTGIDPATLANQVNAHEPFRLFRQQAAHWLPTVYRT